MKNRGLQEFLEEKGAEYAPFDPKRAPKILRNLNLSLRPSQTVIQVIGTNGKGSTGRFLALFLAQLGISVGHFTSPHLLSVCERFWKNGSLVEYEALNASFLELDRESLGEASYFEILTFLALKVFSDCQVVILEAGLGGEYDSTTTCAKSDMTLFTQIGIDHQEFLGNSLEEIAVTKLRAMAKDVLLGFQCYEEVVRIAKKIAKEKDSRLKILVQIPKEIQDYVCAKEYPLYQAENLTLAFEGLCMLTERLGLSNFTLESLLKSLAPLDLQGRLQRLRFNVLLDVAHNLDGANALLRSLKNACFRKNKYVLIYNSFSDKNPKMVLSVLKPIIKRVEILNFSHPRLIQKENLKEILRTLELEYCDFKDISDDESYVVCGSFSVVAEFLKQFK